MAYHEQELEQKIRELEAELLVWKQNVACGTCLFERERSRQAGRLLRQNEEGKKLCDS